MKRAFTLIELMLVIALMGVMGTMAIGGYAAVTRGMSDRAALDAAKSIADAALQRANIDRASTYIYLFDEVLKIDSDMSAGIAQGVAIAVRPCGRITAVPGDGLYCDEFGDLERTFKSLEGVGYDDEMTEGEKKESASTMRIYNLADENYASVAEGVYPFMVTDTDLEEKSNQAGQRGKSVRWQIYGFKKVSGPASFEVGDEYGQEFAVTRLPPGYVFSSSVTMSSVADLGPKRVKVIKVKPTDKNTPSLNVYARRPNGTFDAIGSTSSVKDGEQ